MYYDVKSDFIDFIAYSYLPTDAGRFSEVMTIHFADGKSVEYYPILDFVDKSFNFEKFISEFLSSGDLKLFWNERIKYKLRYKKISK